MVHQFSQKFIQWGAFLALTLGGAGASAQVIPYPRILEGAKLVPKTVQEQFYAVPAGTVVVIGEEHGSAVHQSYQMTMLRELRRLGHTVSVAMEFLAHPFQNEVNEFRYGRLSEEDFLSRIGWGGFSFEFYRSQILFPKLPKEKTLAINAPQAVTAKIAKQGLASLTPEEWAQLPPDFAQNGRGNDAYFARFKEQMGHHVKDPAKLENYFLAQSAWDDTMAWKVTDFMQKHPDHVVALIVGDFHVRFSGGLPDRLRKRGAIFVHTVSMINTSGMSAAEIDSEITAQPPAGIRADYIWLSEF